MRNRIGLSTAGTLYTSPAWSMNVVYARLNPAGTVSTFFLGVMLGFFRISASILYWCCGWRNRLWQSSGAGWGSQGAGEIFISTSPLMDPVLCMLAILLTA